MTQTLLPDSTVASGSWSPGAYTDVNADDGTYAQSEQVNGSSTTTLEVGLQDGTDPAVATGHVIRVRWFASGGGGAYADGVCELVEGTTVIATLTSASQLGGTETEDTYTLSAGEANSISDYTDLRLRLYASDARRKLYVDLAQFEIPDAPSGTNHEETASDDVGVTDSVAFSLGKIESTSDDVGITDTTPRVVNYKRTVTEAIGVTDPVAQDPPPYSDESYFVPASALDGFDTTDPGETDEWPFTATDEATTNAISGSASHTVGFDFDLSAAPGDKKGLRLWIELEASPGASFSIDEIRLIDNNGPTTLHTNSSPGLPDVDESMGILTYDFPDSALSSDPDLDDLTVEVDVTNLSGGNNVLSCAGVRLSKSPFTAAQEASLPASLSGADFACYRAADVLVLGAADGHDLVVIPDASGGGRHALRWVGSGEIDVIDDTIPYFELPTGHDTRFIWKFDQDEINENTFLAMRAYPTNTASDHPVITGTFQFEGVDLAPGSKQLLGWSSDEYVIMAGDGSGGAHKTGGSPAEDTWAWAGTWTQISGNEHAWENDNTTPVIDAASGSNTLHGGSLFHHEASDRQAEGRVSEIWIVSVPAATYSESDMTDALDEWVNGPGTDHTETATDDAGVTDSTTRAVEAARELSETVGLTDSVSRSIDAARSTDDPVGATDTALAAKSAPRATTEAVGVTDDVAAAKTLTVTITEAVGAADSTTPAKASAQSTTDPVGLTDTVATVHAAVRSVAATAGVSDDTTPAKASIRAVTETVGVSDDTAAAKVSGRNPNDANGVTDVVDRAVTAARSISDEVGVDDTVNTAKTITIVITDTVGLTDQTAADLSAGGVEAVDDTVGVTTSVDRAVTAARSIASPAGVTDTTSAAKTIQVTVTDSIGAGDNATRAKAITLEISDAAGIADNTTRVVDVARAIGDSVGVTSQSTRIVESVRTATESVGATDSVSDNLIVDGTLWWDYDPAGYTTDPAGVTADPADFTPAPAGYSADPAGYTPATPEKNPPL